MTLVKEVLFHNMLSSSPTVLTQVSKEPRTSILMELRDTPGALHEILKYFWKYDVNITNIESRPSKHDGSFEFFIDYHTCEG
jgi:prephenate dehydratase